MGIEMRPERVGPIGLPHPEGVDAIAGENDPTHPLAVAPKESPRYSLSDPTHRAGEEFAIVTGRVEELGQP